MTIEISARTDKAGIVKAHNNGELVTIFKHSGGWSVQCSAGVMVDSGCESFNQLEPLVEALKEVGIDRLFVQP